MLVLALLIGLVAPWVYPTYLGGLGSAIAVLIFAFIVLHFGVLTCFVAVYFSESLSSAIVMLGSGESTLVMHGTILLICALLPASPVLIARRRGLPTPAPIG